MTRNILRSTITSIKNAYRQLSSTCVGVFSLSAIYRPLKEREIRLVVLSPGSAESEIRCKLIYKAVSNSLSYEAVSYTWGDPNITESIILDGRPFTITSGLAIALRHFRHTKEKQILWIDAICINQSNDEEKNHQVQMMLDIYQNATRVRAWIGREPGEESEDHRRSIQRELDRCLGFRKPNLKEVFQASTLDAQQDSWTVWKLIDTFGKRTDSGAKPKEADETSTSRVPSIGKSLESWTELKAWKDLCLLLLRPYWRRVWIQQEIAEVSKVIVHCGSKSFSLTSLFTSHTNFRSYHRSMKQSISGSPDTVRLIEECYLQIFYLQKQSRARNEQPRQILNILRAQTYRETSDPRDKVYGIVGLIPSWRYTFPIDYKLSECQVYIQTFRYVCRKYNRLDFMIERNSVISSGLTGLPSWCPDWSQNALPRHLIPHTGKFVDGFDIPHKLSGSHSNKSPVYSFAKNDHVLTARGVVLDICEKTTSPFMGKRSFLDPRQKEVRDDTLKLACSSLGGPYWSYWQSVEANHQPLDAEKHLATIDIEEARKSLNLSQQDINARWSDQAEAMLRTLTVNVEEYFDEDLFEKYKSQSASIINAEGCENAPNQDKQDASLPGALAESFDETDGEPGCISIGGVYPKLQKLPIYRQPTRHRRFFVSCKKYMGLAPAESRPGDFVCIIFGCHQPVMLRKIDDHYIFLGEVYLHGWMNGEALNLLESGQLQEEDFEIH